MTAKLREIAAEYGPAAVAKLAAMAGLDGTPGAESEQAQLGALRELLDRGYGRPPQAITGGEDGAPVRFVFTRHHQSRPRRTGYGFTRLATLSTSMPRMRTPAAPQFVWPPNNPHTGLDTPCAVERTIAAVSDPGRAG